MPRTPKTLPGYKKLSPAALEARGLSRKAEQYESPSGDLISKRQYLAAQRTAKTGTRVSNEGYAKSRGTANLLHTRARINLFADAYAAGKNRRKRNPANMMTRAQALADPWFQNAYARLQSLHRTRKKNHVPYAPGTRRGFNRQREMNLLFDRLNMRAIVDRDGGHPYPKAQ